MDNRGQGARNGNPVIGYPRNNTPAQIWAIESVRHGNHVHFRNLQRNKCLDDTGVARVNRHYHIWSCSNGNRNQWFRLAVYRRPARPTRLYPNGWFNIVGKTGLCVSARHNRGNLTQQRCGTGADLQWRVIRYRNGLILQARNGRIMDNRGQGARNGNPVIGYPRNNTPAQIWAIESVRHGNHVHFRNLQRNKCLDDTGVARVNRHYHIWSCSNGNRNQWFRLAVYRRPVRPTRPTRPIARMPGNFLNLVGPNGLCVGATRRNGARLYQGFCSRYTDFMWRFYRLRNVYILVNRNGYVMDNAGSRNRNGNPVIGYRRHNKGNQLWVPEMINKRHFILRNPQTNRCLDNQGRPRVGGQYHIWSCSKNNRNQWFSIQTPRPTIRLPVNKFFRLVGPAGRCVWGSRRNGQRLFQRSCAFSRDAMWRFFPNRGGYTIRNQSGFVIDNSGARNRNGNPIIGYRQHNRENQVWVPIMVNRRHFLLYNPQTNKCMDNTGRTNNGAHYHLWSCSTKNKNQLFRLKEVRPRPRPRPRPVRPIRPVRPVRPTRPIFRPGVLPPPHPRPFIPNNLFYIDYHLPIRGPIPYFKPTAGRINVEHLRN